VLQYGLAPSRPGSPDMDYPLMTRETTRLVFAPGGASALVWSYGEALFHAGSRPPTVTQTSLGF
jgi:hypothetical protein